MWELYSVRTRVACHRADVEKGPRVRQGGGAMQAAVAQGGGGPGEPRAGTLRLLCLVCALHVFSPPGAATTELPGRAGPLTGRVHTQRKTIVEMNNKTGEVWLKNPEADANEQVRDAAKRGLGFEDSRRQRTSLAR